MNDVIVQLSNVTAAFLDFLVQIGDEGLLGVLVLRSPTLDHQLHLCVVAGDGDLLALDQQAHYPLGCCAIGIMTSPHIRDGDIEAACVAPVDLLPDMLLPEADKGGDS